MTHPLLVADMASYLEVAGWRRQPDTWNGAAIWVNADGFEVLVPARDDMADSRERSLELVERLSEAEGRSADEVVEEIASPQVDTQRFRLWPGEAAPSGYVGLRTGLGAVQAINDLYDAAARSELEGIRRRHTGRAPAEVGHLLDHVQLGPSKAGSYLLTLRAPVDGLTTSDGSDSLSRRALTLMCKATVAVHTAVKTVRQASGSDYSGFDDAVEEGASGKLCKALSDLGGRGRDRPFEVTFAWARSVSSDIEPTTLEFAHDEPGIIFRGYQLLERLADGEEATITGRITGFLERDRSPGSWRFRVEGELEIGSSPPESPRRMWVSLFRQDDYQKAMRAVNDGLSVRAQGRLASTSPKRVELEPHERGFEVLERD